MSSFQQNHTTRSTTRRGEQKDEEELQEAVPAAVGGEEEEEKGGDGGDVERRLHAELMEKERKTLAPQTQIRYFGSVDSTSVRGTNIAKEFKQYCAAAPGQNFNGVVLPRCEDSAAQPPRACKKGCFCKAVEDDTVTVTKLNLFMNNYLTRRPSLRAKKGETDKRIQVDRLRTYRKVLIKYQQEQIAEGILPEGTALLQDNHDVFDKIVAIHESELALLKRMSTESHEGIDEYTYTQQQFVGIIAPAGIIDGAPPQPTRGPVPAHVQAAIMHLSHNLGHSALLRPDDQALLKQRDKYIRPMEDSESPPGGQQAQHHGFANKGNKANKKAREKYWNTMRNREDPLQCTHFAIAHAKFVIHKVGEYPEATREEHKDHRWKKYPIIPGRMNAGKGRQGDLDTREHIKAATLADHITSNLEFLGIISKKKGHGGRSMRPGEASNAGVSKQQIDIQGHWASDGNQEKYYHKKTIPKQFIRWAAGHPKEGGQFYVRRSFTVDEIVLLFQMCFPQENWTAPNVVNLLQAIDRGIDSVIFEVEEDIDNGVIANPVDRDLQRQVDERKYMCRVFREDISVLWDRMATHPLRSTHPFNTMNFLKFRTAHQRGCENRVQEEQDESSAFYQRNLPAMARGAFNTLTQTVGSLNERIGNIQHMVLQQQQQYWPSAAFAAAVATPMAALCAAPPGSPIASAGLRPFITSPERRIGEIRSIVGLPSAGSSSTSSTSSSSSSSAVAAPAAAAAAAHAAAAPALALPFDFENKETWVLTHRGDVPPEACAFMPDKNLATVDAVLHEFKTRIGPLDHHFGSGVMKKRTSDGSMMSWRSKKRSSGKNTKDRLIAGRKKIVEYVQAAEAVARNSGSGADEIAAARVLAVQELNDRISSQFPNKCPSSLHINWLQDELTKASAGYDQRAAIVERGRATKRAKKNASSGAVGDRSGTADDVDAARGAVGDGSGTADDDAVLPVVQV